MCCRHGPQEECYSKQPMVTHVRAIPERFGLPTKVSVDEIRQLTEGKMSEEGYGPWNVQVIVQEPTDVLVSCRRVGSGC